MTARHAMGERQVDCPACKALIDQNLVTACASVGIENGRSAGAELLLYLGAQHDRLGHEGPRPAASDVETTLPRMALNPTTEKALRTAARKAAEWTAERDRLIRQADEEGGSLREIGAVAGMSHTAVRFIAHGRPS